MEKAKYNKSPSLSVASVHNTNTTANDDIDQKVCDKYKKGDKKEDHEKVIKCEGLPNRKINTSSLRLNLKKSYDSKQLYTNRLNV